MTTKTIERRTEQVGGRVTPTTKVSLARILQPGESVADWIERHALADARRIQRKPGAADPRLWRAVVAVCDMDTAAKIAAAWAEGDAE